MAKRSVTAFATVSDGAARSVAGPSRGFQAINVAAEANVDLSEYVGQYVYIEVENQDFWVAFVPASTDTMTEALAVALSSGKFAATTYVPRQVFAGQAGIHVVVPGDRPFLSYQQKAGADGLIRVLRS